MRAVFVYTPGMKTAVPDPTPHPNYTNTLILSVGLLFMLMALGLVLVMVAAPQKTAVSPAPVPTIEPMKTTTDPVQTAVTGKTISWQRKNYQWELTPRARFQVVGRVLSRQTYTRDWQSEIAPLDLAIGWGELNDTRVDSYVDWSQSGRWYYFRWDQDGPYDRTYLNTHSSNIHIIPATESLETVLLKIRKDDRILLEGQLVDVEATNAKKRWQNQTSLTRADSGNGACEILLVERLIWNGQEYN
jgi:hypothetical protein